MNLSQKTVKLDDRSFELYIQEEHILSSIRKVAQQINEVYTGKQPLLVPVLNGSFMFASELMKDIQIECMLSFVKTASYVGTGSSGKVTQLIGLNEDISGRDIIIVEDIVDTGHTLHRLLPEIQKHNPASLKIATLLHKPNATVVDIKPDFVGMEIPNDFIVGFGLDYNGLGRNLRDIYKVL